MVKGTTVLDEVTEKYNEEMGKEKDKMQLLYDQLKLTNAGSEERKVIIDKINSTYGTTLKNLDDETAFLIQLEDAYRGVVAQMEKKLMQQIIEDEYLDALKQKREAQKAIDELSASDYVLDIAGTTSVLGSLDEANEKIALLREEMKRLNLVTTDTGKKYSDLNRKVFPFDEESNETAVDGVKSVSKEVQDLGIEIQNLEKDSRLFLERWEARSDKDFITIDPEDEPTNDENLTDSIIPDGSGLTLEEEADLLKKAQEQRKKFAQDSIDLLKKVTDAVITEIDKRIAKEEEQLSESEKTEDYFRELAKAGNADAAESVFAHG